MLNKARALFSEFYGTTLLITNLLYRRLTEHDTSTRAHALETHIEET